MGFTSPREAARFPLAQQQDNFSFSPGLGEGPGALVVFLVVFRQMGHFRARPRRLPAGPRSGLRLLRPGLRTLRRAEEEEGRKGRGRGAK